MRVLNICNLKGGVGKTITSVNLAYVIAHVHKMRVLVIDNDKQGNIYENPELVSNEADT